MTPLPADPERHPGTLFAPGRRASRRAIALISMLAFGPSPSSLRCPLWPAALDGLSSMPCLWRDAGDVHGRHGAGRRVCDRRGARRSTVLGLLLFLSRGCCWPAWRRRWRCWCWAVPCRTWAAGCWGGALCRPRPAGACAAAPRCSPCSRPPGGAGPRRAGVGVLLVITLGWRWVFSLSRWRCRSRPALLPALRRAGQGDGGVLRWQRLRWAMAAAAGAVICTRPARRVPGPGRCCCSVWPWRCGRRRPAAARQSAGAMACRLCVLLRGLLAAAGARARRPSSPWCSITALNGASGRLAWP